MSSPIIKTYQSEPIIVEGDDLIVDGQELPIKQKLVYAGMHYIESPLTSEIQTSPWNTSQGNSVVVEIRVLTYKRNPDGSFGERWKGNMDYTFNMIANNTTWVDDVTGQILGNVGEEVYAENTQGPLYDADGVEVEPAGKFYGKTMIKESEFFDRIGDAEFQPGVRHLIRQYLTANKSRVQPSSPRF